jgi:hypothetical protein
VKLPPDTDEMTSTSSSSERVPPFHGNVTLRSWFRTPYESALARVPPPENARMTNSSSEFFVTWPFGSSS